MNSETSSAMTNVRAQFESFVSEHQRFINRNRAYAQQYSHLYFTRLVQIQRELSNVCLEKWQSSGLKQVSRILDIQPGVPCICIGTLYKEMALKPNFLHDYMAEIQNARSSEDEDDDNDLDDADDELMTTTTYQSETDQLILEDESGRMTLMLAENNSEATAAAFAQLVTGVVIGVRGIWKKNANFIVEDIGVCGLPPQAPAPSPSGGGPVYLALISGLNMGSQRLNPLSTQLLLDFLAGNVGDVETAKRIARVVIAGNGMTLTDDIKTRDKIQLHTLSASENTAMLGPLKEFDAFVAELGNTCPVDVVPGDNEPTNCFMPQQPLHPCLLPNAAKSKAVSFAANPYKVSVNGLSVLGTSGQPVEDIAKYATFQSSLQILESTLQWRNMAPTAPDTLSVYPFTDQDPFALTQCPHLYFAGNQPKFETTFVRGPSSQCCRVVCIPTFCDSPTLVLVDMASPELAVQTVNIAAL